MFSAYCGANKLQTGTFAQACAKAAECLKTRPASAVVIRRESDLLEVGAFMALEMVERHWTAEQIWKEYGKPERLSP